jgi:membrane fusion protein, multidrug efflux system
MPVPFEKCTGQRIGLALRTLENISLFNVLFLVFKNNTFRRTKGMATETELTSGERKESNGQRTKGRASAKLWVTAAIAGMVILGAWLKYSPSASGSSAGAPPAALPQVVASKPLVLDLDTRLGFLGQLSSVSQVELRAQVGGTLTGIFFKDGDIARKGDLLFTVDPRPYEITLAEATAQLDVATARLELADRQLDRAKDLEQSDAGTVENVDQRTADRRAAQASVEDAKARIRDAQFDLDHCRIAAPFTGRMGTHLVSVGNLIAGSRTATSPTTLLATLVSLDPIYLDFDISESDFLTYSKYRERVKGAHVQRVEVAFGDDKRYTRKGVFDFLDNVLDRSSGTIRARATVPNSDLILTPGQFALVRVVVAPPSPTLLVPDTAVLPDQSQHTVVTVSAEGTVAPKQVEVGDIRGGLRVIRSGLAPSDRVIVGGVLHATPGTKVATQDGTIRYDGGQD